MEENGESQTQVQVQSPPAKLYAALAKAQGKFRTPVLNRTAEVKKDGRLLYKTQYADLQEIIDCVRQPLAENGLSFVQTTKLIDRDWFLMLELLHESGEAKRTAIPIGGWQTNQQLGGTLTYLKRYQLSAFFGLAADFDDDGNSTTGNEVEFDKAKKSDTESKIQSAPKPQPRAEPPPPPADDAFPPIDAGEPFGPLDELYILADERSIAPEKMKQLMKQLCKGKTKSTDLTPEEIDTLIKYIKLMPRGAGND